jgi:hypothetical protein
VKGPEQIYGATTTAKRREKLLPEKQRKSVHRNQILAVILNEFAKTEFLGTETAFAVNAPSIIARDEMQSSR